MDYSEDAVRAAWALLVKPTTAAPVAKPPGPFRPPEPSIPGFTLMRTSDGFARVFVKDEEPNNHVSNYDIFAGM